MKIEVSNGEVLDKYSILVIKSQKITDENKLENIHKEAETLRGEVETMINIFDDGRLEETYKNLYRVNCELWDVEDELRVMERNGDWQVVGSRFVETARSVYKLNDERARLKRMINSITESNLVEEKSYEEY